MTPTTWRSFPHCLRSVCHDQRKQASRHHDWGLRPPFGFHPCWKFKFAFEWYQCILLAALCVLSSQAKRSMRIVNGKEYDVKAAPFLVSVETHFSKQVAKEISLNVERRQHFRSRDFCPDLRPRTKLCLTSWKPVRSRTRHDKWQRIHTYGSVPACKAQLNYWVDGEEGQSLKGNVNCGGTIVDATHILTAAHCLKD